MSAGAPPPPTIVINASSTITAPSTSQPATEPPSKPSRPQNPVVVESCYLCDEQNPGDFSPTTTFLERCLLCSRHFCPIHRSEDRDQLCNINHASYYHECLERARQESQGHGEDNKRAIAEILIRDGIYPSLGEREKAIFATSPVTDGEYIPHTLDVPIGPRGSDKVRRGPWIAQVKERTMWWTWLTPCVQRRYTSWNSTAVSGPRARRMTS